MIDTALLKKLIRQGLLVAGGGLLSNGAMKADDVDTLAGALSVVASVGWMLWAHRKQNEELRMKN